MSRYWVYIAIFICCGVSLWAQSLTDDSGAKIGIMLGTWGCYAGLVALQITMRRLDAIDDAMDMLLEPAFVDRFTHELSDEDRERAMQYLERQQARYFDEQVSRKTCDWHE